MSWILFAGIENKDDNKRRISRIFRDRQNPLELMRENECVQRFRLDKLGIIDLCNLLHNDLQRPTNRSNSLPVVIQICVALRYFASGSFLRVSGDTIGISISSSSIVLHQVAKGLANRIRNFVKFPETEEELTQRKQGFYALKRFPNVIGAIDCTHIMIISPNNLIESDFINRKGFHSINVQAVANSQLEFTNLVAKFPGRVHDSFIWANSGLKDYLITRPNIGWLLGDSGYPLELHLLTPFSAPNNVPQERYNSAHTKTRNVVERAFGVLKMRFRCLAKKMMFRPDRTCHFIMACVVLHNIARKNNFYGEQCDILAESVAENYENNGNAEQNIRALDIRANLVVRNFN